MNEAKEFYGKTVDDAIREACEFFDAEREKLEIEIIDGGSSGIFGLVGTKKAKIQARLRDNTKELEAIIQEVVREMIKTFVGDARITIDTGTDPITVMIEDEENSGLIIGRDGATLSALQYMTNRIVAKKWPERVRIQLDSGDYREKQKENLRNTAVFLAKKAKSSGRTQSTKPLTSYHRRLVHMALQRDEEVQTKSKGEGPMKRVLIFPKAKRSRPEEE
ncbi:MAG: RNA-binding cell elongation regulator Jag/EloR [Desulfovibrionales bacterium]